MKVVIIDDEENCRILLAHKINKYCKEATIVGEASSVKTGINLINEKKPDLIFLDIQMNDGTGFDLLNKIKEIKFKIIFTTAFDQYAIKAFKYSAIHYLLKPLDYIELIDAFNRATKEVNYQEQTKGFLNSYQNGNFDTICIRTEDNLYKLLLSEIELIEAEGSYCIFNLEDKKKIVISKSLKEYEQILPHENFVRVHRSYLINFNFIK